VQLDNYPIIQDIRYTQTMRVCFLCEGAQSAHNHNDPKILADPPAFLDNWIITPG